MRKILIEGPDKCGKTTLAKRLAEEEQCQFLHQPSEPFRSMMFNGDVKDTALTFLLFANTMQVWQEHNKTAHVMDRDILSMLVYHGYLTGNMNPIIILNLFKSVIYADGRGPDTLIYLTNAPFAEYTDDLWERFGYGDIRQAYDQAISLFGFNFPNIEVIRVDLDKDPSWSL